MRVLLIEDEPTTAKSIELMLSGEGFNVYTTDLGEEGLDLGKLYDYDIICLDLNLPDMHGYDVLKKLRTAKVSTPVLILSGIGEMDSKVRALGFGARCFRQRHVDHAVALRDPAAHDRHIIFFDLPRLERFLKLRARFECLLEARPGLRRAGEQ